MEEFLKFDIINDVISVKIIFNTSKYKFSDINYALFSTIFVDKEKKHPLCSVVYYDDKKNLEFRARETENDDEKRKIINCRNIAYSYLKFACIAIIIQSPQEKLDASYFINVSAFPFQVYPGLGELVYEEQFEFCGVIFNSSVEFKNEIIKRFVEAIDGLSPSTRKYRICFFNNVAEKDKFLYSRPTVNDCIPSFANLYTRANPLEIKTFQKIFLDSDLWRTDNKPKDAFYATSFVDIGQPEASMVAASASSGSLFLTPDYGQIRCDQYYLNDRNKFHNLRFLFRSRNYEEPFENMRAFASAFVSSTNIVIPFTVPCYDVIEMLSLFAENPPKCVRKLQEYIDNSQTEKGKYFKKKIIFYIDIPQKGAKNIENAVDNAYQSLISVFENMEVFHFNSPKKNKKEDDHIFKLCKSRTELVNFLKKKEKNDCANLKNDEFIPFVIEDNIQDGMNYFFQNNDDDDDI